MSSDENSINSKIYSNYPSNNYSTESFQSNQNFAANNNTAFQSNFTPNNTNNYNPSGVNYSQNQYPSNNQYPPSIQSNPQSNVAEAQSPYYPYNQQPQNPNQSMFNNSFQNQINSAPSNNYNADQASNQPYQSMFSQSQQGNQALNGPGFYNIPMNPEPERKSDNILTRSTNFAEPKNELEFDGNVRQYYLKYIDNNSALMPLNFRRKIDFLNKINLIIPVACVFNMIMASVNYIPENPPLARKHFFFSTLLIAGTVYYSRIFVKQYQIQSYNELLGKYTESEIKEMVDKTIMINRTL